MMIPVRCFSCGKVIGDKLEPFIQRVAAGESTKKVLDDLGLHRYCCRRMLISHVEIIDEILKFYEQKHKPMDKRTRFIEDVLSHTL